MFRTARLKKVSLEEMRRILGKEVNVKIQGNEHVGKFKSPSEWCLGLDGFKFCYPQDGEERIWSTGKIYPEGLEYPGESDNNRGWSVFRDSNETYHLIAFPDDGNGFSNESFVNPEIKEFMLQRELDLEYA